MKQEGPVIFHDHRQVEYAFDLVQRQPLDGSREMIIRDRRISKTLSQLGLLFGFWLTEASEFTGINEEDLRKQWKMEYLAPIYANDPQGDIQSQFSELYWHYMETQNAEKLAQQIERVSMSHTWGYSKDQMTLFLNKIKRWSMDVGCNLTAPTKFHKYYNDEVVR